MEIDPTETKRPSRNGVVAPPAPKGNRYAEKHGLNTLRDAATRVGSRAIDGRSALCYALKRRRRELVDDLGGPDNLSTQRSALIDLCVKTKLFIDSVDAWLLTQDSLINKRKRNLAAGCSSASAISRRPGALSQPVRHGAAPQD